MTPESNQRLSDPTLTMPHSLHHRGRLVFPEYPNLIIRLTATDVNVLVTLFVAWHRQRHLSEEDRGWVNGKSAHATYQEQTGQTLEVGAVRKYVTRLINRLERQFEKHGLTPPSLIVRDDRGVHLMRTIIIKDLTGEWKAPDEAHPEALSPGQHWNAHCVTESTRQLHAE